MFGFARTKDDIEGQKEAVAWLRACVIAKSGPAFMWSDKRKCQLILAHIDRLERLSSTEEPSP